MTHVRTIRKEEYPQFDRFERRHVAALQRRQAYLRDRLSSGNHSEEAGAYIAAELSALEWAFKMIDNLMKVES
jgi:hypothetical protein